MRVIVLEEGRGKKHIQSSFNFEPVQSSFCFSPPARDYSRTLGSDGILSRTVSCLCTKGQGSITHTFLLICFPPPSLYFTVSKTKLSHQPRFAIESRAPQSCPFCVSEQNDKGSTGTCSAAPGRNNTRQQASTAYYVQAARLSYSMNTGIC